jgi:flagellar FliL protein
MKWAVIGLVAVLLLGGAGAGAYFYLAKPAEAAGGPVDEVKKAEHEAKTAEAEGAAIAQEQFVSLNALVLPVIDEEGVTQTITMVISVEVPDETTAKEVERLSPRLKDAFIQDMYGVLSRKNAMQNGVVQVAMIKERLNRVSKKVLGPEKVNDVLLQVVQQRSVAH